MKNKITRIYDKNKVNSRKKYLLIILAILALQIALYIGTFSKAESIITLKFINYYTLEEYEYNLNTEKDATSDYIIFPEQINNRKVIKYYIDKNVDGNVETCTYEPNDIYYVDEQLQDIKVEYGEEIITSSDELSQETSNNKQSNTAEDNKEEETPEEIFTVYLGECGQEGEEGTELNPFKSIEMAFEALPETGGKIIIKGVAEIPTWASAGVALNKDVIIEAYNDESQILMEGDWLLQGNTTISNGKIIMSQKTSNLSIYANGYELILGTEGEIESLKIDAQNQYYPNIYGGNASANLKGDTNVTIHSGCYQNIFAGSRNKNIEGNTNLNITYSIVYGAVFGGSNGGNITGSTNVNITQGKYGILTKNENENTISGGGINGTISEDATLNISDMVIINGCISGAGTSNVLGSINTNLTNITLAESGQGTNSIYGVSYNGPVTASKNVNITINGIKGNPKYIIGYANVNGGDATTAIKMELRNISGSNTEIYGGSYNGNQTRGASTNIITSNVRAKLISAGGIIEQSIKNYNITINDGCWFSQGIYAGISTNSKGNVANDGNTLTINNYGSENSYGKLYFNNKTANINLSDSFITTSTNFHFANITAVKSTLIIESIYNQNRSLGNLNIDQNSEISVKNTKKLFFDSIQGSGKMRLQDTTTLVINNNVSGPMQVDITEESNSTQHYINIIVNANVEKEEMNFNKELTQYKTDFISGSTTYWKFYTDENKIQSKSDCVYLDSDYGDDNSIGEISSPVKTIEAASKIIKNDSTKKKVVIMSYLDLNKETAKSVDKSDTYTIITATDGNINFQKCINLNSSTYENNIYQNLEFDDIQIKSLNGTQNIYLNGNKLRINGNVSTSNSINIFGGTNTSDLQGINTDIQIKGGTWNEIYGGSNSGNINGKTNVAISGGSIGYVYGGSKTGNITGNTNITISGGTLRTEIIGGSNSGTIIGNTNLNITAGTISGNIYGGNTGTSTINGEISGQINLNISGGIFNTANTNIYAGGKYGITGNISTTISKLTINNAIKVYGGGENVTTNGDITLNIEENANFSQSATVFGGGKTGTITGNIHFKLSNCTFGTGTIIYRGTDSAELVGEIQSTIQNLSFTSTNSYLYLGSNSGKINGDISTSLEKGMFKNNLCNAIVYGGSNSGSINGNVTLNANDITFGNEVYGGSNTGSIDGNNTFSANKSTFNSNLYGIGNLNAIQTGELNYTNTVNVKDSTVKGVLYIINSTGNNVVGNVNAIIENVSLKELYAFKTYNKINKKVNVSISGSKSDSSNGKINLGVVQTDSALDLTQVLHYELNNNKSQISFPKEIKVEHLNINGSNVITEKAFTTTYLTLKGNGCLDVEKAATVTNTFNGDTENNYGEIYVYDGLQIGVATGKTILKIGTIIGNISSPSLSFVKEGALDKDISTTDTQNQTREWTVGYLNYLDVVYVDEISGNDETNMGGTPETALATLKTAYLYSKYGGTIVICGPTTLTTWPTHTEKKITITSKYLDIDYRDTNSAKLILNCEDTTISSINLQADTVFEYLNIEVSKTQNIFANGYSLTLGVEGDNSSIKVIDSNGKDTTAYLNIYGGTYNNSVRTTNLTINSGSYKSIYGGNTNGAYKIGDETSIGTVVENIKITGGKFGNSTTNNTIVAGNNVNSNGFVYGGINLDITNAEINGNILSSGYAATTYGDVTVNINKDVTITGNLFTDQYKGNIESQYKNILNINGEDGTTVIENIFYGSVDKYNSSSRYETNIKNATIGNIYYGSYNNNGIADTVKGPVFITINNGVKIENIYAGRYSQDPTEAGKFYITIATTDSEIGTNIYRNSKNNGGKAPVCDIIFDAVNLDYIGNIDNITNLNINKSSILKIKGQKLSTSNLIVNESELNIEESVNNVAFGTLEIGQDSSAKILNPQENIKISGNFVGGGELYLNDGVKLEISGTVTNSTTIYCNNNTNYFENGTRIVAKLSQETLENAFITPEGKNWNFKDNETTRIWQVPEFYINNIIYINSKIGTEYGLGTSEIPVNTLENAYKIANKRYKEDNLINKYYIVLQESLNVNSNINTALKLDNNIEVIITNKVDSEDLNYENSIMRITTGTLNFIGKTTIENIKIDTTGYKESVEFFANGNNVTFGRGITINSAIEKYPIIYGGGNTNNIQVENIELKILSGEYNMIFGGGKTGSVTGNINLTIGETNQDQINVKKYEKDDDNYTGLFGAGRDGNVIGNITLNINSGEFFRVYGAGIKGTTTGNITINFNNGTTNRLYGGGQRGEVKGNIDEQTGNITINIGNGNGQATIQNYLRGSGQYVGIKGDTNLNIYNGANLLENTQVAAGGYQGNVETSNLNIYGGNIECDVYGGGWGVVGDPSKGLSKNTKVYIHKDVIINGDVYGGGYAGTANNTNVIVENATLNNIYGGGNEAQIQETTNVRLISAQINKSAYAGGKGTTATVKGESSIFIEGTTTIEQSVFGGGNAAITGLVNSNATANVYITGGTIKEDVYGGANTSVVYGNTNVKIGRDAVNIEELNLGDINIFGTVYGGGKSNLAGSEDYDFAFESVTGDVNIDINSKDIQLNIGKSIFASGNAAKISGDGYIRISNYGNIEQPKNLVSIQRATEVLVDNSVLWISGTTDRTNEMSTVIYTINRVERLKLKNDSTLYLSSGVNLVENLYSLASDDTLEYVKIENGITEQNANNKIYLLQGKNMILLTEDGGNGSVYGMMFLGKFDGEQSIGKIEKGIYSLDYKQGQEVKEEDIQAIYKNSYVQAQHYVKHNTQVDGFYTNELTEENTINIQYIVPTPEEGTYYQWIIGEITDDIYYDEIELIASKYASTGQAILNLVGLNAPNMTLETESIDTTLLKDGIILKNEYEIPNIAEQANDANSIFGLTMETSMQGWKANGKTNYIYNNNISNIEGDKIYYADKSIITPLLTFNFVHSKNITQTEELGKVVLRLKAKYLENEELIIKNVIIEIKLATNEATTIDYYEGAIAPGLKYGTFPNIPTNVTATSSISTYYSIYIKDYDKSKYYENYEGYYHAFVSSFVLPEGTKIMMIDKSKNDYEYYYYIVKPEDEINNKKLYKFTDFNVMGTYNEYYNKDASYYNRENNYVLEEFIFQIDFANAKISQDYLKQTFNVQLLDKTDNSIRLTVNDTIYPMMYSLYYNQETEKLLTIDETEFSFYKPENIEFTINTEYNYKIVNSNIVYDTKILENAQGIKITFYLNSERLNKEELEGISAICDDKSYFVREDGSIRFKISDIVSNVDKKIKVNLRQKEDWKIGNYTMKVETIASTDGINSSEIIETEDITIKIHSSDYGLDVILDDNSQIINKETGKTLNDNNTLDFNVKYESELKSPNIRVALYRRDYESIYTPNYTLVNLADYVENELFASNNENEYIVTENPQESQQFILTLKQNLKTGSYKVKFLIYDGEQYIGEVYKMIIIK